MPSPRRDVLTLADLLQPKVPQGAPGVEGPLASAALSPGRGVVTDPGTGIAVLVPAVGLLRGTVEHLGLLDAYRALLAPLAGDEGSVRDRVELELETIVHDLQHEAYEADAAGGDAGVDQCIRTGLLPRAVRIWAALDAYGLLVNARAPRAGDDLSAVTEDMFEDVDVFADEGRALVVALWDLLEGGMHSVEVHVRFEAEMRRRAERALRPVSKKAKRHASRRR